MMTTKLFFCRYSGGYDVTVDWSAVVHCNVGFVDWWCIPCSSMRVYRLSNQTTQPLQKADDQQCPYDWRQKL